MISEMVVSQKGYVALNKKRFEKESCYKENGKKEFTKVASNDIQKI